MEMGWKPNVEVSPPCPRCGSSNTKFCYYNNYSLTQPRYFCKACRRYWTKGGSLRNVPVGGGCRKTRRPKSARNPRPEPSSISAPHQPSTSSTNIDIAAVYANFVNHAPPRPETTSYLHEGTVNIPSVEVHSSCNIMPPEMNGFFEFPAIFPSGILENDLLPPLPGEAPWPNSNDAVLQNQIINSDGQEMMTGGHEEINSELVNGNMGMFSGLNLEAIFRT